MNVTQPEREPPPANNTLPESNVQVKVNVIVEKEKDTTRLLPSFIVWLVLEFIAIIGLGGALAMAVLFFLHAREKLENGGYVSHEMTSYK